MSGCEGCSFKGLSTAVEDSFVIDIPLDAWRDHLEPQEPAQPLQDTRFVVDA